MVDRVKGVEKVTDNPFLNLYNFDVEKRNGKIRKDDCRKWNHLCVRRG